jgi:hypothetical protein
MSEEDNGQISPIDPLTVGELISLAEAAKRSGFSHSLFKQMAQNGRLPARKIGRNWVTTMESVAQYKRNRSYIRKEI